MHAYSIRYTLVFSESFPWPLFESPLLTLSPGLPICRPMVKARDKAPVINYRERGQQQGKWGQVKIYPYKKGVAEKVLR